MAKRKSSGGRESSSQASASNLQPSPTPKDEQSAKRRMSERLRRLQAAGAVNGLLQNGGGGLAIIGAARGGKQFRATRSRAADGPCRRRREDPSKPTARSSKPEMTRR